MARWPWQRATGARPVGKARRTREVVTAEGLRLTLTLAPRGSRVAALLIDLVMMFMVMLATGVVLSRLSHGAFAGVRKPQNAGLQGLIETLQVLWILALFLVPNVWFVWFELGARGATPGKRLLGIRIVV